MGMANELKRMKKNNHEEGGKKKKNRCGVF